MAAKYWIIVDEPRFWWFPWIWRIRHCYGTECEYSYICELYMKALTEATRRQVILLGTGEPQEIRILSEEA